VCRDSRKKQEITNVSAMDGFGNNGAYLPGDYLFVRFISAGGG
jgi:hypothetical protein